MILKDAGVRDVIADRHDLNLFVEAGAGTGKTTALVRRIANLATGVNPVPMREIAAITFTEKAAGELRERLRKELEARVAKEDDTLLSDRARIALRELEHASLQTIHGFVRNILAQFPLEAGLPPGFSLMDDVEASLRFEEWWSDLLESMLEDESLESSWADLVGAELGLHCLREFALNLKRNGAHVLDRTLDPLSQCSAASPGVIGKLLELGGIIDHLLPQCSDPNDKLFLIFSKVPPLLDQLRELAGAGKNLSYADLAAILEMNPGPMRTSGSTAAWGRKGSEVRKEADEFFKELGVFFDRLKGVIAIGKVAELLERIRIALAKDAHCRVEEGRLEFDDLLVVAANMLRTHPEVRQKLRSQYTRILVDEFQDTDPVQVEILVWMSAENVDSPGFDWRQARVSPGRLFFVGDPKQSIYRFRKADIRVYEEVKSRLADEVVNLSTNFRSAREVIEFVNQTFSSMFVQNALQAAYVDLESPPELTGHHDNCVIHMIGAPSEEKVGELRVQEAKDVVKTILCAVEGGDIGDGNGPTRWSVRKGKSEFRPACYRDITILIPTRTSLSLIEFELERVGIPFRVDSRSLLFETQDIRDLLNIARAIEDPSDEVALVGALRSPAFGCSDSDLMSHGTRWDYRKHWQASGSVKSAMEALHRYHLNRSSMLVHTLLEQIVRERRIMELAIVRKRPRDHWRRITLLLDYARTYDDATHGTLRGFLTWVDSMAKSDARVNETVVAELDDDAVSITTIHASKGLEFPIVILAGTSSHNLPTSGVVVATDVEGRVQYKLKTGFHSFGMADIEQEEKELNLLERDRLLYVAATRAKDHLVVSAYHDSSKNGSKDGEATKELGKAMGARLYRSMPEAFQIPMQFNEVPPVYVPTKVVDVQGLAPRNEWIRSRDEALAKAAPAPTRAPTTLAKEVSLWLENDRESIEPKFTFQERSKPQGGADLGRAVHNVLQTIDLSAPIEAHEAALTIQAHQESQDPADVRNLVKKALDSDPVRQAVRGEFWREIFLSAFIEGVLVEGYIDLLYRRSDGAYVVVDYKTDNVKGNSDVKRRMEKYRFQAAAYALVLEQTIGQRPDALKFVFLNHNNPEGEDVENLEDAMQILREYLQWLRRTHVDEVLSVEPDEEPDHRDEHHDAREYELVEV